MRRNTKSSNKLVVDKFLTKKFRSKNQHTLISWLKDITPEIDWVMGEMAFHSYEIEEDKNSDRIVFPFQLCIDKDNAKVEVAELNLYSFTPSPIMREEYELPYMPDKKIQKVFKLDALNQENLESRESILNFLHPILCEYVERKYKVKPINKLLNEK